jgi:hypothetical protein
MAMSTGAKVAIGCGVALVMAGTAAVVGIVGLGYWGKRKLEGFTANEERIDELKRRANANPFVRPADGVIEEAQLLKFIEVRRRMQPVYERYRTQLEDQGRNQEPGLGAVTRGLAMITELRTAQAEAQADVGMSEDEYRFLVEQVYKTAWASEVVRSTGRMPSEAAAAAAEAAAEQMRRSRDEAAQRDASGPAVEGLSEALEKMGDAADQLRDQAEAARQASESTDVPAANLELFRKHEAEIRKYAMTGLEWIGL